MSKPKRHHDAAILELARTLACRLAREDDAAEARGYLAGRLGRGRTCLLRRGDVEIPSDLFEVIYSELDQGGGWKMKLVREMKAARLPFGANRLWAD